MRVRLLLITILAVAVAAIKWLPWWGSTTLLLALALVGVKLGKRLFRRFALGLFEAKSRVLAGASATVHSIRAAESPKPDDDDDFDPEDYEFEEPRHWVHIDVTIAPVGNQATPMQFYEPSELMLVAEDVETAELEDAREVGLVHAVEIDQKDRWVSCEEKLTGTQRVRLLVAAAEGVGAFKFRYYFELLKHGN